MTKHNQDGAISGVALSLILCIILLFGALGFGIWAFMGRQDYKDHSDVKVAAAVKVAKEQESVAKDKQFAEEIKNPLATYNGPDAYGSLVIKYPKTWSGYVDENATSGSQNVLDAYFNPGVVPSINAQSSIFALRAQIINQSYSQVVNSFSQQQQQADVKISAYALPKLPKIVGIRATGTLADETQVDMVILPLRSQTVQIWTEGDQYENDFNTYILPNVTFSP
jgi:hypothetical protein